MPSLKYLIALAGLLSLLAPASARAQDTTPDPAEQPKIQLGPFGFTPRIALTNLGIDTNVLNQAVDPLRDFTTSFVPTVDSSLHVGRGLLSGKTTVELVYFDKTSAQRSHGFGQEGRFDLTLGALTPYATAGRVKTYRRPNAEIDARVGETTRSFGLGVHLRVSWRTTVQLGASEHRLTFDDEQFEGVNLSRALDRRMQIADVNLRVALTPLTTFVVKNTLQHDRFTFASERDTDSVSVLPGFEFKPSALISGSAFVGYRRFQPRRADQAGFSGLVSAVRLGYVLRDTMRLEGRLDRNVEYSIEAAQSYFLATGGTLSLTQMLGRTWDVVLRTGLQYLDYQKVNALDLTGSRRDHTVTYGTGLGYRLRPDTRIGFDLSHVQRLSALASRRYSGFLFGGSFTYGF